MRFGITAFFRLFDSNDFLFANLGLSASKTLPQ